jgi:hypothetical protein
VSSGVGLEVVMDERVLLKLEKHVLNLDAVASAHWEGRKLFVYFLGGRFLSFTGEDAGRVWTAVRGLGSEASAGEVDLEAALLGHGVGTSAP